MKKILFLLLICFIKLNAYEYIVYSDSSQMRIYYSSNGELYVKRTELNGNIIANDNTYQYFMRSLNGIKRNETFYIKKEVFDNILSNDLSLLNDFYTQQTQAILNYYYNNNVFNFANYIIYEDYQLLYNSDGLAVESIVNGVWAGLYDDSERGSSGRLYDSSGVLLYVNAEPVNTFQQWLDPLIQSVVGCLVAAVDLIASPVGVVISVVFVMAILYFVVTVGRRAIQPFEGKVRKRFLGRHNEEV